MKKVDTHLCGSIYGGGCKHLLYAREADAKFGKKN